MLHPQVRQENHHITKVVRQCSRAGPVHYWKKKLSLHLYNNRKQLKHSCIYFSIVTVGKIPTRPTAALVTMTVLRTELRGNESARNRFADEARTPVPIPLILPTKPATHPALHFSQASGVGSHLRCYQEELLTRHDYSGRILLFIAVRARTAADFQPDQGVTGFQIQE